MCEPHDLARLGGLNGSELDVGLVDELYMSLSLIVTGDSGSALRLLAGETAG